MAAWWNRKTAIGIAVAVAIAVLILMLGPSSWRVISRDGDPPVVAAGQDDLPDGGNPTHAQARRKPTPWRRMPPRSSKNVQAMR